MRSRVSFFAALALLTSFWLPLPTPVSAGEPPSPNSPLFADYFRAETASLAERCLSDCPTLAAWENHRQEYRRQLLEMLGLWPLPERTDLKPVVTGELVQEDFRVEKLHFQALPRLYVTANLYLPKKIDKPVPAILYVCGHSRVVTNGVSCGNKAGYQHHGAWFARNGYACLVLDSLQLGEIQGDHHGTHHLGQWWWNSRGYTPAGVEAWFGIRALDYLCSRPEVDTARIGMTGRSGGGSYTWTVAALDDRVKVAAPVAGITDLRNQVVDGAVEGHCDCMFFVNTYRWDFPQLAALLAPRPLLIANTDKDTIFPLDGVIRLHTQVRRIYALYGQTNRLGLLITDGPHADTQDLQVPVFRWFNRFLKNEDPVIEMATRKFFAPEQLRVFQQLPADELNTTIQKSFVAQAPQPPPGNLPPSEAQLAELKQTLRAKVFAAWPSEIGPRPLALSADTKLHGLRLRQYCLTTQPGIDLNLQVLQSARKRRPSQILLIVLDAQTWSNSPAAAGGSTWPLPDLADNVRRDLEAGQVALAYLAPRGVELSQWPADPAKANHVRRRFMLLGQTLDSMRVWDIRCAAQTLKALPEFKKSPLTLRAQGPMGVNAAYAALFEPGIERLELQGLPASHSDGPDYLNVLKIWDLPQLLDLLRPRLAPVW